MRKEPTQKRGHVTVQSILDAAQMLLVEVGYDTATESPQVLLDAAEVSRGAFYAYFTNPEEVMDTLALGYMAEARDMADALAKQPFTTVREVASAFIETYRAYYERPQVRELWLKGHLSRKAQAADEEANFYIAERLQDALRRLPLDCTQLRLAPCEITLEILDYGLRYAMRTDPVGDPALVEEVNVAATAYLSTYVHA